MRFPRTKITTKSRSRMQMALPLLGLLAACGASYPTVEAPGLKKPKILMLFKFPAGSVCRVQTSSGTVEIATMPGAIDFAQKDRNAPASCTLPTGNKVRITAHNAVPGNNSVAGITVYPDGRAYITSATTSGDLVQLQPVDTVK